MGRRGQNKKEINKCSVITPFNILTVKYCNTERKPAMFGQRTVTGD